MANKQTTGAVISLLGTATVIAACSGSKSETEAAERLMEKIASGGMGVPSKKVMVRSYERGAIGGGLIKSGPDQIPVWGTN